MILRRTIDIPTTVLLVAALWATSGHCAEILVTADSSIDHSIVIVRGYSPDLSAEPRIIHALPPQADTREYGMRGYVSLAGDKNAMELALNTQ